MGEFAPDDASAARPRATVTSDPFLGCRWVRCRPAGPAGAHELRLPGGVLARVDRAEPTAVLDVSVILDADGSVPATAVELLELFVGPGPTALVCRGEEGTAQADPEHSERRNALLALVSLDIDPDDAGPSLVAAEAAFLAAQASASLSEWAAPFVRSGRRACLLLGPAVTDAEDGDGGAHLALSQLAAAVGAGPVRPPHDAVPDLDPEAFEAMWAGAKALALTAPARVRSVRPLQQMTVKLAGMPVNPRVFKGPVTVEYDQAQGEVVATAELVVPVARLWLRIVEPDGSRSCQVPFIETGRDVIQATAVAQGVLDADFDVEVTDDRTAPSMSRAERARHAARSEGEAARRLVDALLAAPASAAATRWSAAARAWSTCADAWTVAGDGPRAWLALEYATTCYERHGDDFSANHERGRADRLRNEGDGGSGWATPYQAGHELLRLPRKQLAALAAPRVATWAKEALAKLELRRQDDPNAIADLETAVEALLEIARMTGDDPSIRAPRGKASLAIASVALSVNRVDIAGDLIERGLTDLAAARPPAADPSWALGRSLLDALAERERHA